MKTLLFFIAILFAVSCYAQRSELCPIPRSENYKHSYYSFSYNYEKKSANWTIYISTREHCLLKVAGRSVVFTIDPLLSSLQCLPANYTKSGYDRGHLVPANDMTFSKTAMLESFYLSNVSPQNPTLNRGLWKNLETFVHALAIADTLLHVVTGPIFSPGSKTIGPQKIPVPASFFKIVYKPGFHPFMLAWNIPNQPLTGFFQSYRVCVDSLETITGFDFFNQLPDSLENRLESVPVTK